MILPDNPWNRFVARATGDALRIEQEAPLYALFWYQAEVNNGGHYQYFLNRPNPSEWALAISAARGLAQDDVADTLADAVRRWQGTQRQAPESPEEFVAEALEDEFGDYDGRFYALESGLFAAMERAVS